MSSPYTQAIAAVRRANLKLLAMEYGGVKQLAERVGRSVNQLNQLISGSIDPRTLEPKQISDGLARELESSTLHNHGWMDKIQEPSKSLKKRTQLKGLVDSFGIARLCIVTGVNSTLISDILAFRKTFATTVEHKIIKKLGLPSDWFSLQNPEICKVAQDIRRQKLALLTNRYETTTAFAEAHALNHSHIRQLLSGSADFGERLARKLEQLTNMPEAWLDIPVDSDNKTAIPGLPVLSHDMQALIIRLTQLDQSNKADARLIRSLNALLDVSEPFLNTFEKDANCTR